MSDAPPPHSTARSLRRNTLAILLFWLLASLVLWVGFSWYQARQRAALLPYVEAGGQLVIPRSRDGHFYVPGEVNHVPVTFMVDTGATGVAISESLARTAQLPDGMPISIDTAGGERAAHIVRNVPVKAGPLARNDTSVIVGVQGGAANAALLGQSFLRHFEVVIDGDRMTLRPR